MEKQIITFSANEQKLQKTSGIDCYASNTVAYIEAHFDLGENWDGYDSVRAVWWNDYNKTVATVLDSDGTCVVPYEVLTRKSAVKVNLVGSIADGDVLTDRLTTCPVVALTIKCNAKTDGDNTQPITPSQFEQFVASVRTDADRAEEASVSARTSADEAEASAQNASESASASTVSASDSARSATASAGYAQNASESAITAETAKDDAESARDEILGMRATAETLEAGSDATASYSDGLLTLGIPRGDRGEQGIQGETGATPNLTIGTVETLAPTEDATASITGTAENPVLNLGLPKGDTGEVSLEDLGALLPTDTASGDIVTIPDGQSVIPAESLKVALEPIQDLNGYDKPWSGGNGKNKLPSIGATFTDSGVTWTLNDDGSVKLSGTASANSVYDFGRNVVELEAGTYFANETASGYSVTVFSIVGGTASVIKSGGGQFTLTEKTSVFMRVLVASGTTPNTTIYPQIEKNTSFTSYEPYSNICPISGRTECDTYVSGINVWDEEWENGYLSSTGQPASDPTAIRSKNFVRVVPNTTYYGKSPVPMGIRFYDESQTFVGTASVNNATFMTPSNAQYLKFYCANTATYNHDISINYPSTDHDYHAYNGTSYTTDLGRTVYGGTLDVVSGLLTVTHVKVTSADVTYGVYDAGTHRISIVLPQSMPDHFKGTDSTAANMYCSNLKVTSKNGVTSGYGNISYSDSTNLRMFIARVNENVSTIAQMETWASNNPFEIVYELATPQTIQLTPQEVQLLLGNNNVWSDGDVTMTYNADIQRYIDKKLSGNSTTSMLSMSRPMVQTETTETEETETETAETE